jgi:serine protease Do
MRSRTRGYKQGENILMAGIGEIGERLRRSTVRIGTGDGGMGSGVVWSADGLIVTNSHVARTEEVEVALWDGRELRATVASRDPRRDLAAVRIEAQGLEAAAAGDSAALRPGAVVVAVGNPLGFAGAMSAGVVHSIGQLPGMGRQRWIRANIRLAPGNSGGPLAEARGRVVGINTAVVNGLGVAAPVAAVQDFLERGVPPMLGVTLRPVQEGLLVLDVHRGSAAEASALRAGDVLLCSMDELGDALDSGDGVIKLKFLRGDGRKVREVFVRKLVRAKAA